MAEALQPGDVFAGHRIEAVAGRGGMGVVYRATHMALDHVVALKVISPALAQDERFRRRFGEESRIAVSIRHPNVVQIHHAGEEDGLLFVTMDLIEGTDLRGLLREQARLDPAHAAEHRRGGRVGPRRRARARARPPRHQAGQRADRGRGGGRARLPHRLRACAPGRGHDRADGHRRVRRHARLRRPGADPRRAGRRPRRRLRARLRALRAAHRHSALRLPRGQGGEDVRAPAGGADQRARAAAGAAGRGRAGDRADPGEGPG